jgi:uncharacterized protein
MPRPTHLLYLHGFRSSPRSFKARRLLDWLALHRPEVHAWCPQLPPSPRDAMAQVTDGTRDWPAVGSVVVGSSLGGFYATALAEARGWPALLLNPAVDPARDLAAHIGEQTAFHAPEERFFFRPEFVDELRALTVPAITRPERYAGLITQGDEVLDWREMAARYAGTRLRVLPGGDHAISDFETHLPFVVGQLGLD